MSICYFNSFFNGIEFSMNNLSNISIIFIIIIILIILQKSVYFLFARSQFTMKSQNRYILKFYIFADSETTYWSNKYRRPKLNPKNPKHSCFIHLVSKYKNAFRNINALEHNSCKRPNKLERIQTYF